MCHRLISRLATTCFVVLALGATVAQAGLITLAPNDSNSSITLADLLDPSGQYDGILVGDKEFTEFFYSTLPGDDMPDAENIGVFGFMDQDGNYGVSFHGAFIDLPGGGSSDALLRFNVDVSADAAANGWRISDAHLFMGGVGLGENSFFSIDESFEGLDKTLHVLRSTLTDPASLKIADTVYFDELHTGLRVTKDIFALSGDPQQPARVTVIDQSFSQTQIVVPEPMTIGLVGIALLGIVASRRRS